MWYNPTFTAEQYAAKVTGVLGFFPFVVGLPVFLAVYAEDLRCRALHTAIGCGVARGCIVAAKLLESALLLLGAAAVLALPVLAAPVALGLDPDAGQLAGLALTLGAEWLRAWATRPWRPCRCSVPRTPSTGSSCMCCCPPGRCTSC